MTLRKDISEERWAYTKKERCFHKSWIFCLENNFANELTDIEEIVGFALLHANTSICEWTTMGQ
jgi:hypothetical protein